MARIKKLVTEDNEQITEVAPDPVKTDGEGTESAKTLHPGAKGINDPKSRVERIAAMIGAAHAAKDEDLIKLYNGMMAYHDKAGHGMGVGDGNAAHNAGTLATHPSAASSITSNVKEAIAQDVEKMLDGSELSEEFKNEAKILFEAAVEARVASIQVELTEAYEQALDEEITEIGSELVGTLDQYLNYAASEWMKENEVAVESALRNEMTSEFINGLRKLFVEHAINIPEDQVEIVDTMASKIEELETRLNDALSENATLYQTVSEHEKAKAVEKICEGLTLSESEQLRQLVENIEADDLETFTKKATVIKESNFVKGATKKKTITESMEQVDDENTSNEPKKYSSPTMKHYAEAITRSLRQT